MKQFLEGHILPKCTKREIYKLNNAMPTKDIESQINNLPPKRTPGSMWFHSCILSNI